MLEEKVNELDKRLSVVETKLEAQGKKICVLLQKVDEVRSVVVELATSNEYEKKEIQEIKTDLKETNKEMVGVKLKQVAIAAAAGLGGSGILAGLVKIFS